MKKIPFQITYRTRYKQRAIQTHVTYKAAVSPEKMRALFERQLSDEFSENKDNFWWEIVSIETYDYDEHAKERRQTLQEIEDGDPHLYRVHL